MKLNTRAKEIYWVNPGGPDNSQGIRSLPSHLKIGLSVGTVKESEVRPTCVQLKGKAKWELNLVSDHLVKVLFSRHLIGRTFGTLCHKATDIRVVL